MERITCPICGKGAPGAEDWMPIDVPSATGWKQRWVHRACLFPEPAPEPEPVLPPGCDKAVWTLLEETRGRLADVWRIWLSRPC